jgi:hypothetical protein
MRGRGPHVEGALGRQVDGEAEIAQAVEQELALAAELGPDGLGLGPGVGGAEQADGGPLQRPEAPPSRNEPALETASITRFGADGPGDPPARVAPVLGEPVEDDHRVAVDVLDVARPR